MWALRKELSLSCCAGRAGCRTWRPNRQEPTGLGPGAAIQPPGASCGASSKYHGCMIPCTDSNYLFPVHVEYACTAHPPGLWQTAGGVHAGQGVARVPRAASVRWCQVQHHHACTCRAVRNTVPEITAPLCCLHSASGTPSAVPVLHNTSVWRTCRMCYQHDTVSLHGEGQACCRMLQALSHKGRR